MSTPEEFPESSIKDIVHHPESPITYREPLDPISLPTAAELLRLDFRKLKPGQPIVIEPLNGK